MNYELLSLNKRIEYLKMVEGTREALIPSAFSIIDIITFLYNNKLILEDPEIPDIFISKGHAASVLYPFIADKEKIEINYSLDGSSYGIYANVEIPYIHMPSGSLGHGLGVAIGLALSKKITYQNKNIFVVLGDGECFEGSIWEALMFIVNSNLNSIIPIIDYNDRTILGDISKTYSKFDLLSKLKGFGLNVINFNGHNFKEISSAIELSTKSDAPSCLFANTIKGKGISFMEESHLWHNRMPNEDLFKKAMNELNKIQ